MKTYICLFTLVVLLIASCNIFNSKDKTEDEFNGEVSVNMNNEEWYKSELNAAKTVTFFQALLVKSSRNINQNLNKPMLSIALEKTHYNSNTEVIIISFELPENATLENLVGLEVEYGKQESKYNGDNIIFFVEKDYDLYVGHYSHINNDYPAWARITAVDYENEIIEGEFEFSLVVRNMYREEPYTKWRNLPDTLHFTKGYFKLPVEDLRNRD